MKQSSFEHINSLPLTFDGGHVMGRGGEPDRPTHNERASLLLCRNCNQGVLVLEEQWTGEKRSKEQTAGGVISWRGFHWWPLPGAVLHEAIPAGIRSAFEESILALAANCPRASAVMARRTLEAVSVEQGEATGPLAQRLNALAARGLLHPSLTDWIKEVRLVGNAGAHFDPMDTVDVKDAQDLINFIRELLNFMYVLPWQLKQRRTAPP